MGESKVATPGDLQHPVGIGPCPVVENGQLECSLTGMSISEDPGTVSQFLGH
jgi:hypothetical protein